MFKLNQKKLRHNKKLIVTFLIIAACSFLGVYFPADNAVHTLTKSLFFFFVIPVVYIKYILKEKVSDYGLNLKNMKSGLAWGGGMLVVSSAIMYLVIEYTGYLKFYKIDLQLAYNFWLFLVSMLVYTNINLFFLEYFFRGFIMQTTSAFFSVWSIPIQAGLYAAIVLAVLGFRGEAWQMAPYFIMSVTGGMTAYCNKSMLYSWASGLIFLILTNAYVIHLLKTN